MDKSVKNWKTHKAKINAPSYPYIVIVIFTIGVLLFGLGLRNWFSGKRELTKGGRYGPSSWYQTEIAGLILIASSVCGFWHWRKQNEKYQPN